MVNVGPECREEGSNVGECRGVSGARLFGASSDKSRARVPRNALIMNAALWQC